MRKFTIPALLAAFSMTASCQENANLNNVVEATPVEEPNVVDPERLDLNYVSDEAPCFYALRNEESFAAHDGVIAKGNASALRHYKSAVVEQFGEHNIDQLLEVEAQRLFEKKPTVAHNPEVFKKEILGTAGACKDMLRLERQMTPQ